MAATWTTGIVASGGEDIYWEYSAVPTSDGHPNIEQPVVVLTHGAGGSHAVWFQQVPALLDAGFGVVTWDSRGFGNSTYRSGALGATEAASDLEAVLDALQISEPVHLVGQSMGGWYVTEFALSRPERTRSLALCDTIGSLFTDELREAMVEFGRRGGLAGGGGPAQVGATIAAGRADTTRGFLYQQLGTFHTPPLQEIGTVLSETIHTPEEVSALGVPVLVLAGDSDPIFPPGPLRNMAQLLTSATFVEIADAGHSPYFEQPEAFNQALLRFLQA
jgi:3-oxoadipate enol-lactonase